MDLFKLEKLKGSKNKKKRIGRGIGSGKGGHTVGKGNKGQKARAGKHKPWQGFEGGQVPLYKRLPRLSGFKRKHVTNYVAVSLDMLNAYENGVEITPAKLIEDSMVRTRKNSVIKILNSGVLKKKIALKGFLFSESARKAVEKAGAKIIE